MNLPSEQQVVSGLPVGSLGCFSKSTLNYCHQHSDPTVNIFKKTGNSAACKTEQFDS